MREFRHQKDILRFRISLMQTLFLAYLSSAHHNSVKVSFKGICSLLNCTRLSKKVKTGFVSESETGL